MSKAEKYTPPSRRQRTLMFVLGIKDNPQTGHAATWLINRELVKRGLGGRTRGGKFRMEDHVIKIEETKTP